MPNAFDKLPKNFFEPLTSSRKRLYADVLLEVYKIFETSVSPRIYEETIFSAVCSHLGAKLAEDSFQDETQTPEEERRTITGKAHILINRLVGWGWFERDKVEDQKTIITLPPYTRAQMQFLHDCVEAETEKSATYVYNTYASLKQADTPGTTAQQQLFALDGAFRITKELTRKLKSIYHDIRAYYRTLVDEFSDLAKILDIHYNEFGEKLLDRDIKALKIDAVDLYKTAICTTLARWLADETLLLALADEMNKNEPERDHDDCYTTVVQRFIWISEQYSSSLSLILDDIDAQKNHYIRQTRRRVENIVNSGKGNIQGQLHQILFALSGKGEQKRKAAELILNGSVIGDCSLVDQTCLYSRKKAEKRTFENELEASDNIDDSEFDDCADEFLKSARQRARAERQILKKIDSAPNGVLHSSDMPVASDDEYFDVFLAALFANATDKYEIEYGEGTVKKGIYTIPCITFSRATTAKEGFIVV